MQVPLQPDSSLKTKLTNVWEWTGEALDEGDLASEYLSDYMGHKVRLMAYAGRSLDFQPHSCSKGVSGAGRQRLDFAGDRLFVMNDENNFQWGQIVWQVIWGNL